MKQLPTAEELITKVANEHSYETWGEMMYDTHEHSQIEYTREAMIEFAKLHVEAALKAASETEVLYLRNGNAYTDEKAIINSYPLTNIK